jgi:hypothetical protein
LGGRLEVPGKLSKFLLGLLDVFVLGHFFCLHVIFDFLHHFLMTILVISQNCKLAEQTAYMVDQFCTPHSVEELQGYHFLREWLETLGREYIEDVYKWVCLKVVVGCLL